MPVTANERDEQQAKQMTGEDGGKTRRQLLMKHVEDSQLKHRAELVGEARRQQLVQYEERPGSDHRVSELCLMGRFEDVLLFMRGNDAMTDLHPSGMPRCSPVVFQCLKCARCREALHDHLRESAHAVGNERDKTGWSGHQVGLHHLRLPCWVHGLASGTEEEDFSRCLLPQLA